MLIENYQTTRLVRAAEPECVVSTERGEVLVKADVPRAELSMHMNKTLSSTVKAVWLIGVGYILLKGCPIGMQCSSSNNVRPAGPFQEFAHRGRR